MITLDKNIFAQHPEWESIMPLFFQKQWLSALNIENYAQIIDYEENELIAIGLFPYDKKLGLKIARNPLLTPYSGFAFIKPLSEDAQAEKIKQYLTYLPKFDSFDFQFYPNVNAFLPLHQAHYQITPYITYLYDLSHPIDFYHQQLPKSRKYYLNKNNKEITIQNIAPDWDTFFSHHQQPYKYKKTYYPYLSNWLKMVTQKSLEQNWGQFLTAYDPDNHFLGAVWVVWDKDTMYLLLSAYNESFRKQKAIESLIWAAIQLAYQKSLKFFDFEGSMDEGIEPFFKSFKGKRTIYYRVKRCPSLIWNLKQLFLK